MAIIVTMVAPIRAGLDVPVINFGRSGLDVTITAMVPRGIDIGGRNGSDFLLAVTFSYWVGGEVVHDTRVVPVDETTSLGVFTNQIVQGSVALIQYSTSLQHVPDNGSLIQVEAEMLH
jgi:hypothetical protein